MIELLLKYGASVDCQKNGWTPFLISCQQGYVEIARLLKNKGRV